MFYFLNFLFNSKFSKINFSGVTVALINAIIHPINTVINDFRHNIPPYTNSHELSSNCSECAQVAPPLSLSPSSLHFIQLSTRHYVTIRPSRSPFRCVCEKTNKLRPIFVYGDCFFLRVLRYEFVYFLLGNDEVFGNFR